MHPKVPPYFFSVIDTIRFYEQLYKGRTWLLKKEKKDVREEVTSTIDRYIDYSVSYYLKKGDIYYPVNNKRSLLRALKDKGPDLKKFMRKNGLKLKEEKETTLVKVSAWYDSLNQQ